jgi:hypothetical protein
MPPKAVRKGHHLSLGAWHNILIDGFKVRNAILEGLTHYFLIELRFYR